MEGTGCVANELGKRSSTLGEDRAPDFSCVRDTQHTLPSLSLSLYLDNDAKVEGTGYVANELPGEDRAPDFSRGKATLLPTIATLFVLLLHMHIAHIIHPLHLH